MPKDDDVLNVLNSNTNNSFSEETSDDELKVLNKNTENLNPVVSVDRKNKYGINLSEEESSARESANLDLVAGVNHVDDKEVGFLKQQEEFGEGSESRRTTVLDGIKYNEDGTPNTTKSLATDLVEEEKSLSTNELYRDTLGRTAYQDLKSACGLADNESFTDFYNRTHYIPKGWEVEARMCLIEEKRMKLYSEYAAGNMSESDFLYQAYGKDLMKESGYDLSSKLFWYNRIKNGDRTNPLDSDTFLTDLISNSRSMFQSESWYRESVSKQMSETLAGLVTGNRLSDEKFYEIFKTQVDALKPYFEDDVNKIITYYKAGSLGSAFSPFIDIDGDNKYDYYYHTDGRLYAVNESSGVGNSKCTVAYNDDGSVHSVQINDGFDGPIDSLLEGFRDFWVGIVDIIQMVDSAIGISAIVHAAKGDDYFIDAHQNWEAFKKSTWALGDEDYVVFDDVKSYNGNDWANSICKGIGQVAGMILLTVATMGIGTALTGAKEGINAGTKVGTTIAENAIAAGVEQSVSSMSIASITEAVTKELGEKATTAAINRGVQQAISVMSKELSKSMGKAAFEASIKGVTSTLLHKAGTTATKLAVKNVATAIGKGATTVLQAGTKARVGFTFLPAKGALGSVWSQSMQIAATSAIKDFVQVGTSLEARNPALQYLEKVTDGKVKALSTSEIWGRAAATAGADFVITSLFRAQGDIGVSTRWNKLFKNHSDLTSNAIALLNDPNITTSVKNAALNMTNHMGRAMFVDNAFDILENITTAGAQAAFSNPYAKLGFGSSESWETFWQSAYNPQSLIMNAYIGMKNTISFGSSANMVDSRKSTFIRTVNMNATKLADMIPSYISRIDSLGGDPVDRDKKITALNNLQKAVIAKLSEPSTADGKISASAKSLNNTIEVAQMLDKVFDVDDKTATDIFGLDKDGIEEVRSAIKYLNSTKGADDAEYGLATGVLFNTARKEYANEMRNVYTDLINSTSERATSNNRVWKTIADFTGKLPFADYLKRKQAVSSFNRLIESVATQQGIDIAKIRDTDVLDLIVAKRFKTLSLDVNETSYNKFKQAIDSGLIKTYVLSDASALEGLQFEASVDAEGKTVMNVVDSNKQPVTNLSEYESNPFFQMLMDPKNNRAAIQHLIELGIINSANGANDRESLYNIIASGTPWFGFTIDQSKRNEILSGDNNELRDVVIAMDTIADLFDPKVSGSTDGYAGINWSTPLLARVNYQRKNGSGGISDSFLYIVPNLSNQTQLDTVNRLQTAQALIYNYYKIYSLSKLPALSTDQVEELQAAIASYAMLIDENLVMDDLESINKIFTDETARSNYLHEHMPDVVKAILLRSDMSVEENKNGYGRNQLIRLYRDGILDEKILTDLRDTSEKGTNVGKVANEILQYKELVETSKSVIKILSTYNSEGSILNEDIKILQKYISTMNDPRNQTLRDYLEKDNRITPYIKKILANPEDYFPFLKGLDGNGRRLSLEDYSAISKRHGSNDEGFNEFIATVIDSYTNEYVRYSNNYSKSVKKTLSNLFYGKNVPAQYNYFEHLSTDQLIEFISDPITKLNELKNTGSFDLLFGRKVNLNTIRGVDEAVEGKGISTILTEDNKIDTNKLFNVIYDESLSPIQIKHDLLKGESDNAVMFRKLLMIATNNISGEFPVRYTDIEGTSHDFIKVKNGILLIGPKEETVGDILFKNENVKLFFEESKKENISQLITKDIQNLDTYLGKDSELTISKNIIEVNLLELLPKNLKSAVSKMVESASLKAKTGMLADAERDKLESEINNLFTGTFSNSMAEQYAAYRKFVTSHLIDGNFILQYRINSGEGADSSINKFKTLMAALGYGKDVGKIISGALVIDGVSVKDKPTHVLTSDVTAQKIYNYLINNNPISFIKSKDDGKDYVNVLRNLLSSNIYVNDNTKFNFLDDKGKPIKIFGVTLNGSSDSWGISEDVGSTYLDRAIKAALQGGNFAKVFQTLNRSTLFTGDGNQLSYETFKALKIINAVFDYYSADKEYKWYPSRINVSSEEIKNKILETYSKDYSLWNAEYEDSSKSVLLTFNPNADIDKFIEHISKNGFDFREVFPIWNPSSSLKSMNDVGTRNVSYETLFTEISQLGFEDLRTTEDFFNLASKGPIKVLSLDTNEYETLVNKLNGLTLSEIEKVLEDNNKLVESNYYANTLAYEIKKARASTNVLTNALNTEETKNILPLCNDDVLKQLGSLLNDRFKNIFIDGINDENVKLLTDALNEILNNPEYRTVKRYNTSADYYRIDSGVDSIMKLSPSYSEEISTDSIKSLLNILSLADDSQLTRLSNDTGLARRSAILSCFNFLESTNDGRLTVSLEDYIKAPQNDRLALIAELQKIISMKNLDFDESELSSLKTLVSQLQEKNALISELNADRKLTQETSALLTVLSMEQNKENAPSLRFNPDYFMSSGKEFNKMLAAQLIANRSLIKQNENKFITLSSIAGKFSGNYAEKNSLSKFMANAINRTLPATTDKLGSAMIYNMQSDEAIGEFFLSSYSWAQLVKESLFRDSDGNFINKFKGLNEKQVDNMLYDLAMKANLYSTGTTFAAEYAGALMLIYDSETKSYEIKPIITSVDNPDDDIYFSLLFGENNLTSLENSNKTVYMFKVKQNSFIDNISGYESGFDMFDLNDEKVRNALIAGAYFNARKNNGSVFYIEPSKLVDYQDVFKKYYIDNYKLKSYELRQNYINSAKKLGLTDDIINRTLQTVENLSVLQPTSWTEQAVNEILSVTGRLVKEGNYQFVAIHDALLYGINKDSLSEQTFNTFRNYIVSLEDNLGENNITLMNRAINNFNSQDPEDFKTFISEFNEMDVQTKIATIKKLFVEEDNINGLTLTLIANTRDGKNLYDSFQDLIAQTTKYGLDESYSSEVHDLYNKLLRTFNTPEEFSEILKAISFDELSLKSDFDLFENVKNNFIRDNKFLKETLDAFNLMEVTKSLRADSKELDKVVKNVLMGSAYTSSTRQSFISTLKNRRTRNDGRNIILNLLSQNGLNIEEMSLEDVDNNADIKNAVQQTAQSISFAARNYLNDLKKKNPYDDDIQTMSVSDSIELFLSSGKTNMIKYLNKDKQFAFKDFDKSTLNKFDNKDNRILPALLKNFDFKSTEESSNVERFVRSVMSPLRMHMESDGEEYLNNINPSFLLSNLIRISGYTTEGQELFNKKLDQYNNIGKIIEISSKANDMLYDYFINEFFQSELYQKRALWQMAHERSEFRESGAYGTIYVNPELVNKAFDTNYKNGDEFYTLMWRQPGQQTTVMHNVKVVCDNTTTMAFTRRTARDFFNGDFDGDSYFFAKPDSASQVFGKETFDTLMYGGSIYDSLFSGIRIPASSAKEYAETEKLIRPFFELNSTIQLFKNITSADEINGKLSEWLMNNHPELSEERIDYLVDAFGIKEFNTALTDSSVKYRSSNYLLRKIGDAYKDVVELLDKGQEAFLRSAFNANKEDATWLGQSSKGQKKNFNVSKNEIKNVSDSLFETSLGMSKDSATYLNNIFNVLSDSDKQIVKTNIINYINKGINLGFISNDDANLLINRLNLNPINADTVYIVAQLLQDSKINSEKYNSIIKSALSSNELQLERSKNNEKLLGLIDIMKQIGGYDGIGELEKQLKDNPYGPQTLDIGSKLASMLLDRRLLQNDLFNAMSNTTGASKLLRDFATKANVEVLSKNNVNIISHKNNVNIHKNIIGLTGKVAIAIDTSGEYSDSIGVYDRSLNGSKNLFVNQLKQYSLGELTGKQRDGLFNYIKSLRGPIDSNDLQNILKDSNLVINGKQEILAIVNKYGKPISISSLKLEDLTPGTQIVFASKNSIIDTTRNNLVKFGASTTKDFKGTGYVTEVKFDKTIKSDEVPQFIIPESIASLEKLSVLTGFENPNKIIKDANGKEYALCYIDNMALLNALDLEDMSISNRNMDAVSLLSGSQGIDAVFNMGNLFIEMDENGNLIFNPNSYHNLMSTIGKYTKPILQDVNGTNLVRYNRIAILLNELSNREDLNKIIQNINPDVNTIKDLLSSLEDCGDLGGYYGSRIENYLKVSLGKDGYNKLLAKASNKHNPFIRVFFSKEIEELLNPTRITTASQDENYLAQKKEDVFKENTRISNVSGYTDDLRFVKAMEGSAEDLNTSFISRRSILQNLLSSLAEHQGKNGGLNSSLINELIKSNIIKPEEIYSGNIADDYRPILKYQGVTIDPDSIVELTQHKKDGRLSSMNYATRNEEALNITGYVGESLMRHNSDHEFDTALFDDMLVANDGAYRSSRFNDAYYYTPATKMFSFLTSGTDEEIADALTGYKSKVLLDRQSKQLKLNNGKLSLGIDFSTYHDFRAQGAPDNFLTASFSQASDYIKKLENFDKEQSKLYAQLVSRKELESSNQLRDLNLESRLQLLEDRQKLSVEEESVKAFRKMLEQEHIEDLNKDYDNYSTITQSSYSDACWDNLSEANIIAAVKLSSSKNGLDFYNSAMRTWGFKSDGNQDIAIGSRVVRVNVLADNETRSILGNEYMRLINASKYDKNLFLELDTYLQIQKDLELYETLIKNEKEFRRSMPQTGTGSYDSCLEKIKSTISSSYGGLEGLKQTLDSIYKNNLSLQLLIDDAATINRRIIEAAKQDGPYAMVPWFINMTNMESDNKMIGWETVNAFNFSKQSFDDLLSGSLSVPNKTKFASLFSHNSNGYISSITIAANNLAKKKAMKSFAKYMTDNGYMSNLSLYSAAYDKVSNLITGYINENGERVDGFIDTFNKAFAERKISEKQYAFDEYTYNVLRHAAIECKLNPDEFEGYESFSNLFSYLFSTATDQLEKLNFTSFSELVEARNSMVGIENDSADREKLDNAIQIFNTAQNTLSTIVAMMVERGQYKSANEFLSTLKTAALSSSNALGENSEYVIVDKYGAKLEGEDKYAPAFLQSFDIDDAIRELNYGRGIKGETRDAAIAQMILCGDAYIMKRSLADQLEKKLFTKVKHSKVYNILNKAKSLSTSLIMSSPVQLLDRVINFPTFDLGVDATADFRTLEFVPNARATINKFVAMFDNLTQEQIDNDPDMQYLIRFLYASNQDLKNSESYRGEKLSTSSLPVLKQYLKLTNKLYNIGNLIPRFAYYLNLVKNAETRGYDIDPMRMGVTYHMQDGIKKLTGDVDLNVYKSLIQYDEDGNIKNMDELQKAANIDIQASQIIAEHNGLEGNMPYAAKWLNEHFNTMFVTFPMALLRWGNNRLQSLGYALSQITKDTGAWKYIGEQVASNVITGSVLLALQLLLSTNTQNYLKKKISKKDDEITEEEQEAAFNILFRGGQVKIFSSLMNGEETSTAAHSRGPISALFDSYIADFIPAYNSNYENFFKTFMDKVKEKTLGHTNFIVKDAIESIPGNTWLQSSNYYTPGDNFFENYGRKVLGYILGSANANALIDYYKTADETTDDGFLKKLRNGMEYAFTRKFANTKEAKSEHRNYKQAFSLVYEYKQAIATSPVDYTASDTNNFKNLTNDLRNALTYMGDSASLYNVIAKYKQQRVALSTIKSAIKSVSLKQQILNLGDYNKFMMSLTPQERAKIKSAIAYEDYNYPFLDDIYQELSDEYQKEKSKQSSRYVSSVGSLLRTMNYNTPKNYKNSYNRNSRNYYNYNSFVNRYLNNVSYNNRYKQKSNGPLEAFNNSMNNISYGTSTDIYGNEIRHYTDGTAYTVRTPGISFLGGNK